ncbi:MAG: hypothetical protein FD127_4539 [Acidimicrobiaceae bacterium]|nr:MAG: hypothetical protein FD127_4539 [Acidimicrobiaceae bacterium]
MAVVAAAADVRVTVAVRVGGGARQSPIDAALVGWSGVGVAAGVCAEHVHAASAAHDDDGAREK